MGFPSVLLEPLEFFLQFLMLLSTSGMASG